MSTNKKNVNTSKSLARKFILSPETPFIVSEAYKSARTNLLFSLASKKDKAVVVTSCLPGEGKSTTAINLAITIAAAGSKILLIDADIRKPVVHSYLKLNKNIGLSTILSGMCPVSAGIIKNVRKNLDVIPSGPIPPNASELLSTPNTKALLDVLKENYDYVIIDTPPVNVVSDALLFNDSTAGMVMVIKDNSSKHTELKKALNNIKMTNGKVLGFIRTCVDSSGKRRGNYYYNYNYEYSQSNKLSGK